MQQDMLHVHPIGATRLNAIGGGKTLNISCLRSIFIVPFRDP